MRFVCVLLATGLACGQSVQYQGVASAKQIMEGIQKPAMDRLAAMLKVGGPKDDKEWEVAQRNAAVLAETAQLLLMGNRPLDQDVWVKSSARLNQAAVTSTKAAEAKDLAAWKTSLGNMGAACKSCHNVHKKKKNE
jgi:cytochrome c556